MWESDENGTKRRERCGQGRAHSSGVRRDDVRSVRPERGTAGKGLTEEKIYVRRHRLTEDPYMLPVEVGS